jgi:RNA polymerase-binding transcription factor DksA
MTSMSNQIDAQTRLLDERARLERQVHELNNERRSDGPIDMLGGDAGADTATLTAELHLLSDLEHSIAEVDAALRRIENGTYGIDEETGEPIDAARLEAVPTARTNVR